jgi:hypothetical protein
VWLSSHVAPSLSRYVRATSARLLIGQVVMCTLAALCLLDALALF